MEQHGFPGFASHRAEHRRLLKTLIDSAHKLQRDDIRMRPLLCSFQSYFVDHIAEFDRQYGPWLNERASIDGLLPAIEPCPRHPAKRDRISAQLRGLFCRCSRMETDKWPS